MSQKILVIDDSATIRHLVDSELSPSGYEVVLCPTAEDGILRSRSEDPDLIILDHQLPGTTGIEVCRQLIDDPELSRIPVVISSTLRKKAYAEYTEMSNVVDMLAKPYTGDLLRMTVANALETGAMVVESQSAGSAVPEVIQDVQDVRLQGDFGDFALREVLDFLNNGAKNGVLEVEAARGRVWFYLDGGRVQAVTATGVSPSVVAERLPESLQSLGPVLNFTVGGRACSEVDGLVGLLNRNVLDPRLLRKLLRHQAAVLTWLCFTGDLVGFRFQSDAQVPPLFQELRLDTSLLALLVDGALHCNESELPEEAGETVYARCNLHGQNLDRSGLSATHMKVLGLLAQPVSSAELAEKLGCDQDEARRVLHGFVLAELAEARRQQSARIVIAIEKDAIGAREIRELLADASGAFKGRVVRDRMALELVLKRCQPDVLLAAVDDEECRELAAEFGPRLKENGARLVALGAEGETDGFDAAVPRPFKSNDLRALLAETGDAARACATVA